MFDWIHSQAPVSALLHNSFEKVILRKYLGVRALLEKLRGDLGIPCLVSGSGSACFAVISHEESMVGAKRLIRECWEADTFIVESRPLTVCS